MIVQAYACVVAWVYVLLQNIIILLCFFTDVDGMLSCGFRYITDYIN